MRGVSVLCGVCGRVLLKNFTLKYGNVNRRKYVCNAYWNCVHCQEKLKKVRLSTFIIKTWRKRLHEISFRIVGLCRPHKQQKLHEWRRFVIFFMQSVCAIVCTVHPSVFVTRFCQIYTQFSTQLTEITQGLSTKLTGTRMQGRFTQILTQNANSAHNS